MLSSPEPVQNATICHRKRLCHPEKTVRWTDTHASIGNCKVEFNGKRIISYSEFILRCMLKECEDSDLAKWEIILLETRIITSTVTQVSISLEPLTLHVIFV
jgi:hypothetical protein